MLNVCVIYEYNSMFILNLKSILNLIELISHLPEFHIHISPERHVFEPEFQ